MKTTLKMRAIARVAALASVGAALSGCVYDVGLGYASDGYYDDAYGCDPYSNYDRYYDCDYDHGFNNIGYGGGWYDNYYYPGYGFFLFDNIGRRYPMRDHHRRYWGERRYSWYRENRGRDGDGGRYQRRNRGYTDGATPGAHSWRDRHDGRARNGSDNKHYDRRDGRRGVDDQWRGGRGGSVNAVPLPIPGAVESGGAERARDDGFERSDRRGDRSADAVVPPPVRLQQDSGAARSPQPRPERAHPLPRRGRDEGDNVRDR